MISAYTSHCMDNVMPASRLECGMRCITIAEGGVVHASVGQWSHGPVMHNRLQCSTARDWYQSCCFYCVGACLADGPDELLEEGRGLVEQMFVWQE